MVNGKTTQVCEKCQGTLATDREVDMLTGMTLIVYRCINCGRRTRLDNVPRPLTGS